MDIDKTKNYNIDESDIVLEYRNYIITSDRRVLKKKGNKFEECNPNDKVANFLKDACKQPDKYDFTQDRDER